MFKNLKIGTRLGFGFSFVVALLLIIGVQSIVNMKRINQGLATVYNDRLIPADQFAKINELMQENMRQLHLASMHDPRIEESKLHDHAITMHLEKVAQNLNTIGVLWKEYMANDLTPEEKILADEFATRQTAFIQNGLEQAAQLYAVGKFPEANTHMVKGTGPLYAKLREVGATLFQLQIDVAKTEFEKADAEYRRGFAISIAIVVTGPLIAGLLAFLISRSITVPLVRAVDVATRLANGDLTIKIESDSKDEVGMLMGALQAMIGKLTQIIGEVRTAADNLSNAAGQVSATAQSLSKSSSEQAASVEETTSSMEQMTASISQNTENAKVTDGMASKSAKEAAEGGDAVCKTVEDMKSIAGKIGIIDDIAYQTNLLALNAAIEAARAGDHGKGFAVVAAEVRKLAERSQIAAQEIGSLASSSVKQAERAGTLLTEMVPSIRKTSDLVQEIASASQEQSSGVAQINGAMGQLNQAMQQNASASEQLAATAEELGSQAEQLQQTMIFFHLDDKQQRTARRLTEPVRVNTTRAGATGVARLAAVQVNEGNFERF